MYIINTFYIYKLFSYYFRIFLRSFRCRRRTLRSLKCYRTIESTTTTTSTRTTNHQRHHTDRYRSTGATTIISRPPLLRLSSTIDHQQQHRSPVWQPLTVFNWSSSQPPPHDCSSRSTIITASSPVDSYRHESIVDGDDSGCDDDSISTVIANSQSGHKRHRYGTTTTSWIAEVKIVDTNCGGGSGGSGAQRPRIYVKPLNGCHRGDSISITAL